MVEPFQSVFMSWHWVALMVLAWWSVTAWIFRERLASHKWSGDISARPGFLVLLMLIFIAASALAYFALAVPQP